MFGLGRKSIAQKIYEGLEGVEDEGGTWLVIYDFKSKPNPRFWGNLRRLNRLVGEGELIQYSVYKSRSRRGALSAMKIAEYYGGALSAMKIAEYYGAEVVIFKGEVYDF